LLLLLLWALTWWRALLLLLLLQSRHHLLWLYHQLLLLKGVARQCKPIEQQQLRVWQGPIRQEHLLVLLHRPEALEL
jgi:hypothetical protein